MGLRVEIARRPWAGVPDDALLAFGYGSPPAEPAGDARVVQTGLPVANGEPAMELWRVAAPVATDVEGDVRHSAARDFLCGIVEFEEARFAGVADAAEAAYRRMCEFQSGRPQRHLLRVWNFIDAINEGDGDRERYRQFCIGRARGLGDLPAERLPAATAVGRPRAAGRVQVCWLAGREPGSPVENPRQLRAYRYPRDYGPSPPAFARAMRLETGELMGSGTSSIVGHESRHDGDLALQVDETLENLRELHRAGGGKGAPTGVKVYLRDPSGEREVAGRVGAGLPAAAPPLLIEADICRRELLVEIECLWI